MECGTVNQSSAGSRPGDNFVSPEFNLVLVAAMTLMLRRTTMIIGYLVDVVAGGLLLYGTLVRKQILYESRWTSNFCAASEETVYNFFVYSLVSWVASAIIEFKSCKFLICNIQLGGYVVRTLNKKQLFGLALSLIVSINACWVMLQYSSAVHKSFERWTDDPWLLLYYLMAATAKNSRVFLQGLVLTSWVPWGFLPGRYGRKRMAMGRIRMGITNSFMLLQAIFLSTFPSDGSMNTTNTISLFVDFAYRIISCVWFLETGFSPLLSFLKKRCNGIEDSTHTAAEADPNIVHETLEDLNCEADPNKVSRTPEDLDHVAALADPHSNELMLNNLQATTNSTNNNTTVSTVCYFLPASENQAMQPLGTDQHQRVEVEPHSVEESSPSLNHPAGNMLTSHNLFVAYDDPHFECQKLIDSHIGHKHNNLEVNQPFHDNSDLHTHPIPFHDLYDQEVFQLKSNTSFFIPTLGDN